MKKRTPKLHLHRETVRTLSHAGLGQAAGGACSLHICPTVCTQINCPTVEVCQSPPG